MDGRSGSPVGSISIAPKPPVSASSITCSIRVRKLSMAFGSSSTRRNAASFLAASAASTPSAPRRTRTCQSIAATRSLITLIARRTTGVSANLRRFMGVGLGRSRPGNCTGLRIEGSASVLRCASASAPLADTSPLAPACPACRVACRHISRNCSAIFTRTFLFRLFTKAKRHSPHKRTMPSLQPVYSSPRRSLIGNPCADVVPEPN